MKLKLAYCDVGAFAALLAILAVLVVVNNVRVCVLQSEPNAYGACAQLEAMPDIALATESIADLNLHDAAPASLEFELDLGDGAAHFSTGTVYI